MYVTHTHERLAVHTLHPITTGLQVMTRQNDPGNKKLTVSYPNLVKVLKGFGLNRSLDVMR